MKKHQKFFIILTALYFVSEISSLQANATTSFDVDYAYFRKIPIVYDYGTLHLYLKNPSEAEVAVDEIWVNDVLMKDLPNDLAVWYQVLPNPVPPHKVADVMVRLIKPIEPPFKLQIKTSTGQTITKSIDIITPPLKITYIGFNDELNRLYIYLQNTGDKSLSVERVYIDANDITKLTKVPWVELLPQTKDCIIADLETPLTQGEFIAIKVETKEGPIMEAVVRVFSFFPITSWDDDTREELHFDPIPFKIDYPSDLSKFEETKKVEPHRAYYLFDDPTCTDSRTDSILGKSAMEIIRRAQVCYKYDPLHPGFTHICEYRKEFGYFVYSEVVDIVFVNPYELVFYGFSPRDDGYFVEIAKLGCEPRPLMVIPEAFQEAAMWGPPTPEEERLIVYYEISRGAKGVSYFLRGGSGGYEAYPSLEAEIGRINWELQNIKDYLKIGDPVPMADCNEPRVEANTILCGDEAIVLILINTHHKSFRERGHRRLEIWTKRNFTVTIHLPKWLTAQEVYEVVGASKSIKKVDFTVKATEQGIALILPITKLSLPRIFVVRTNNTQEASCMKHLVKSAPGRRIRVDHTISPVIRDFGRFTQTTEAVSKLFRYSTCLSLPP